MTRVMVVDGAPLFRSGLRLLLEQSATISLVAEAHTVKEAMEILMSIEVLPEVVITELKFHEGSVQPLLQHIVALQKAGKYCRALVLTELPERTHGYLAQAWGAHGFMMKDSSEASMLEAISEVGGGGHFFAKMATGKVEGRSPPSRLAEYIGPLAAKYGLELLQECHFV